MLFTHTVKTQYLSSCYNIDGIGSVCHSILIFSFNGQGSLLGSVCHSILLFSFNSQGSLLGSFLFEERMCFGVVIKDTMVCTYCFAFSLLFWTILVVPCVM